MAVIGVGHLGKEHARILSTFADVDLVGVCDVNGEQARLVAQCCGTTPFADYHALIASIDAAVIAVPTWGHHAVAVDCLEAGIHLLVEKPLAPSVAAARELVIRARRQDTLLQVGHIERFNPAVEQLTRLQLKPKWIECERLGPFTGRSTDIGVVLDLMIHDLDLVRVLAGPDVQDVEAVGWVVHGGHEDVAHARLVFAPSLTVILSASRASSAPRRQMRLGADDGIVSIDFAARTFSINPTARRSHGGRRQLAAPGLDRPPDSSETPLTAADPLTRELREFVDCVRYGLRPRVTAEDGLAAVELADLILRRIREQPTTNTPGAAPPWIRNGNSDIAA
jgi:predicted dehydrogenase